MLCGGFREMVRTGFRIQRIVEVVGVLRHQRGVQAVQAGVGNRTGGQTGVRVGVVGGIQFQIGLSQGLCFPFRIQVAVQRVYQRRVDVQEGGVIAPAVQAVINDGADRVGFADVGGFLLGQRGS